MIENQVLKVGFNVFNENIQTDDMIISFFNVIVYKKLVREEIQKTRFVTKSMLNSKQFLDIMKILSANKIELSDMDKEDVARYISETKTLTKEEINDLIETCKRKGRVYKPQSETNVKFAYMVKVARHVYVNNRIEIMPPCDFEVDTIGWNILQMDNTVFFDENGDKQDPNNIINLCKEFYINTSTLTFSAFNVPKRSYRSFKIDDIKKIRDEFCELMHEAIYFDNDELYPFFFYWTLHTFLFRIFDYTGYINIFAPTSSGKTTLMKFIREINRYSIIATVPTTATIFRLANSGYMLLWDENVSLQNMEKDSSIDQLSILRVGFDKNASDIPRCNDNNEVVIYSAFCPKAICNEHDLPDELESLKNRMFHIFMKTTERDLKDLSYLKPRLDVLSQKMIDYAFSLFSRYFLSYILFLEHKAGKKINFPKIIKKKMKLLIEYNKQFEKLKHRMQDISMPLIILASDFKEDLESIHSFLLNQQEYLLNEITQTSPQYNLLKCIADLIDKNPSLIEHGWYGKKDDEKNGDYIKVYNKGEEQYLEIDDCIRFEKDTNIISIKNSSLKLILKSHYNFYKFTANDMIDCMRVFHIKNTMKKPHGYLWYNFSKDALKEAFKRKQIVLGIDEKTTKTIDDYTAQKKLDESKQQEITIKLANSDSTEYLTEESIKEKIMEYLGNANSTMFDDLIDILSIKDSRSVENFKLILKIMETEEILEIDDSGLISLK